jgi:hypothetical protein
MRTRLGMIQLLMGVMGCQALGGLNVRGGMSGSCSGDLGATAGAQKVEAFIASAAAFSQSAVDLNRGLRDGCLQIGTALEIPQGELAASDDPEGTRRICERAARQLREEVTALRGGANLTLRMDVQPPRCEISVDAYGRCAADCDVSYRPGVAEVQCEGGELRGTCSAQCTGRCAVEVNGSCNGTCEGQCSATDAQGRCTGTCQGRCVAQASGSCGGECRGGCSVAYTEPRCTGRVVPPAVNADCRAACDARLNAQASCQPGRASLAIDGNVSSDLEARVRRVRAALGSGYGAVLQVREQVERTARTGEALARAIAELPSAAQQIGVAAGLCAAGSVAAVTQAVASVNVSVQVSVQVSASAQVN